MENYNLNPLQIINNSVYNNCLNLNNYLKENSLNKIMFIYYIQNKEYIYFKYYNKLS